MPIVPTVPLASIESAGRSAVQALLRFPVPIGCAWGACAYLDALILVGGKHDGAMGVGFALMLGIPVCFALTLLGERGATGRPAWVQWLPQLGALLALGALALAWPGWTGEVQWRRYAQLSLLAHALVAFLPYLAVREANGFWQYNRTLLERFVLASIFSAVLLLGLQGALASLKPLFGIQVSGKAFGLLATWVAFVFHPWFFLAGIPSDLRALEERRDYPATVRVFAQFILVPLVAVYQALLTAYLLKVVVTGKWPSGLIGWLVSAEAIAGMLAILLVHPVRERAENLWVRTFARGFYIALVPSIAMLAVSIAKRVGQYGVTEDRYFLIALTAWLGAISVFFIARRDGDIRWIPATLAALALLTFGGPWSAYDVSLASQRARLVHLLRENDMLRDGHAVPPPKGLTSAARRELSGLLKYLLGRHGSPVLRPVLGDAQVSSDAQRVAAGLGFAYMDSWEVANDDTRAFSWMAPWNAPRPAYRVEGSEYHVRIDQVPARFQAGSRGLALWCDDKGRRVVLADDPEPRGALPPWGRADTLAMATLDSLVAEARGPRDPGAGPLHLRLTGPGARGTLHVTQLFGVERPEFRVNSLSGELYFTLLGTPRDTSGVAHRR